MVKQPHLLFKEGKKFINIPDVKSTLEQPPLFGHLPGQQVALNLLRGHESVRYIPYIRNKQTKKLL